MNTPGKPLYDLLPMDSPEAIRDEVCAILKLIFTDFDVTPVEGAFQATRSLFRGEYPGYRACNTGYHDIHHSMAALLATVRLVHGAVIEGYTFKERSIVLLMMSALLHDAGYIQKKEDLDGSGAKYTADHVRRSMCFFEVVGPSWGLSDEEIAAGCLMILSTELSTNIATLSFPDEEIDLLARLLAAGDLIGQRADRAYPEKLVLLYHEFKEGGIGNFEDEVDFFRDAIRFASFSQDHLKRILPQSSTFLRAHFKTRWGLDEDSYKTATEKNDRHIRTIAGRPDKDIRRLLRRNQKLMDGLGYLKGKR
jgi:hypothetical protein